MPHIHTQKFVCLSSVSEGIDPGCGQLSWMIEESPDFGPYLLFLRLEPEISQTIAEVCHFNPTIKFQVF